MKKIALLSFMLLLCGSIFAQMEDDFESNQWGWNERSDNKGVALVKDGVMHIESKSKPIFATVYAPFDIDKPFILTCEALVKKINNDKIFGIVLDYEDENNYMCFYLSEDEAKLEVFREDKLIAKRYEAIKLNSGKSVGVTFEVEYALNELVFKVNGVKAMTYRRRLEKDQFLLGTSGIGFFARNGQVIDFDNLKIIQ